MVSSAIYRYFPSRDDLLTALIIEAYEHLADAIEGAEQSVSRADYRGRWLASGRGLRRWAVAHPHEWGLIYGTPVPGYRAPEATVAPVVRAANVVMDIQRDQFADASAFAPTTAQPMNDEVRAAIAPLLATFPDANSDALALGFASWVGLIGLVSFELFGHMHNVVNDAAKFYDHELNRLADQLALGS